MKKIILIEILLLCYAGSICGQIYASSSARASQSGGVYRQIYGAQMHSVNRSIQAKKSSTTNMWMTITMPVAQVSSTSQPIALLNETQKNCRRMAIRARDIQEGLCLTDAEFQEAIEAQEDAYKQSGPHKMPPPTEAPIGQLPWIMMAMMMAGYVVWRKKTAKMA